MTVGAPLECVGIDITGPHPKSSSGFMYILTIVDHFSRWAEAYPIRNQEASTVARVLVNEFISRFGCPKQLLSDQGPCFEARLFQDICALLGIDKLRTSPYKPSTNGAVERFHRTLNSLIAKAVSQNQKDWDLHLPYLLAAYRASESESTGFSPNRLFLGRELNLPIDLVLGDSQMAPNLYTHDDFVSEQLTRMQNDFCLARQFMRRQVTLRAARYDMRVRNADFKPGDMVWYFYPRKRPGIKDKWAKWYTGPFKVLEKLGPVLYRIQKTPRSQPQVVYVDKLKRVISSPDNTPWEPAGTSSLPEEGITLPLPAEPETHSESGRPRRNIVRPSRFST